MNKEIKYPCPCCGYIVFNEPSGSYDICPVCRWEDDDVQLRELLKSGANKISLIDAQKNFEKIGAKDEASVGKVVQKNDFKKDQTWRMFDQEKDEISMSSQEYMSIFKEDPFKVYYWKR